MTLWVQCVRHAFGEHKHDLTVSLTSEVNFCLLSQN